MNVICRRFFILPLVFLVFTGFLGKVRAQTSSFRLISDSTCNGIVQLHMVSYQVSAINALTIAIPYDTLSLNFDTIIRKHPRLANGSFNPLNPLRGMVFSWYVIDSVNFGTDTLLTFRFRAAPNSGGAFNFDPNFFFCGLNNNPVPVSRFGSIWRSQSTEPPVATAPPLAQGLIGRTFSFAYRPGYCTDTMIFQWSRSGLFPSSVTYSNFVGRSQRIPGNYATTFLGFNVAAGDSVLFWRWAAILRGDTSYGPISRLVLPPCNVQNIPSIGSSGPTSFCQNSFVTLSLPLQPFWTYQWFNGNMPIIGAVSNTYTASMSGNYSVQIIDELGCRGVTQSEGVEVWPLPNPIVSPSGNLTICQGSSQLLTAQGVPGSTYQWFYNNNLVINATSNTFQATQSGAYSVRETSIRGCSSLTSSIQLSVSPNANSSLAATICQGQGYAFGTQLLTNSGIYTRTLLSSNGCDSVITVSLSVIPTSTNSLNATICQGQYYAFGLQTLTASGTYIRTVAAYSGCDSIITLNLLVIQPSSSTIFASICQGQSYGFGSQNITSSGTYTRTILASNGCDSVIVLNLQVLSNRDTLLSVIICEGQSYLFGQRLLMASGNYFRMIPASNGCDSLVQLNLLVRPPVTTSILVSICYGQTFNFGNQVLSSSGNYRLIGISTNGCDSIIDLQLFVRPIIVSTLFASICQGDVYIFGANSLSVSGNYTRTVSAANGCDSVINLNLDVRPVQSSLFSFSLCYGQSYMFGNQFISTAGNYTRTVQGENGCDSTITLHLLILPLSNTTLTATICQGQGFNFGSLNLTTSGTYIRSISASNGCDSVITLNLLVRDISSTTITATICQGQSYAFGQQILTASGIYSNVVPSANGCDSSTVLSLFVRAVSNTYLSASICQGQFYTFGQQVLTASGIYPKVLTSVNGCDSVIVLNLMVRPNSSGALTATICQGQSFVFGQQVINTAGIYSRIVSASNGCDSVITLNLNVGPSYVTSLNASICAGQTFSFGGIVYSLSGTYQDTLSSISSGCDSIVVLNLTVLSMLTQTITDSICQGQLYSFGSQLLSQPGSYSRYLMAGNGCDSMISLTLIVRPVSNSAISISLCEGQVYFFGNQLISTAGTYTRSLVSSIGCDSVIILQVFMVPRSYTLLNVSICQGQGYNFIAQNLITSGVYTDTVPNFVGCDSIITLILNVISNSFTSISASVCQGQSYIFGSQVLISSGVYSLTRRSFNGCDSVVLLSLTVRPNSSTIISDFICQGQTYSFGSQVLSNSGTYLRTLPSSSGCDSVITLNLMVRSNSAASISELVCEGQTYTFGSLFLTSTGIYTRVLTSSNGCDSVITLSLAVRPNSLTSMTSIICQGQAFQFGPQTLTAAGFYTRVVPAANGCDSLITLTLTVRPNTTSSLTAEICQGQSYSFGTQSLTTTGTHVRTILASNGCDSTITLNLIVRPNSLSAISVSVCQGQSYAFGSQSLNVPGTYTRTLVAANGCDSVITLNLSFRPNSTTTVEDSICVGSVYLFGAQVLTISGIYTQSQQAANGCDSLTVLTLTVLPSSSSSLQAFICQGDYYWFGGDTLRNAGFYTDTLVAVNGCDSVVFLQLRVNATPQVNITPLGNTVLCQGDSVTLLAGAGLNLIYVWRRNGIIIPAASSSTYSATLAGLYQVLITDTSGCSSLSNTLNILVNPLPQPVATLSGRLLSLSGGSFASYQWYRNSVAIMGANLATYTADSGGVYACLVSQGPCSALSNLVTVAGVGLESLKQTQWWFYPNPNRGLLMLRGAAATKANLIDLGGRRYFLDVQPSSYVGNSLEMQDQALDLGDLPSGVYWLELYGERNLFLGRRKVIRILD